MWYLTFTMNCLVEGLIYRPNRESEVVQNIGQTLTGYHSYTMVTSQVEVDLRNLWVIANLSFSKEW